MQDTEPQSGAAGERLKWLAEPSSNPGEAPFMPFEGHVGFKIKGSKFRSGKVRTKAVTNNSIKQ